MVALKTNAVGLILGDDVANAHIWLYDRGSLRIVGLQVDCVVTGSTLVTILVLLFSVSIVLVVVIVTILFIIVFVTILFVVLVVLVILIVVVLVVLVVLVIIFELVIVPFADFTGNAVSAPPIP